MEIGWSALKSNSMPSDSGKERRNISPRWRSSSVTASSTVKTWTPDLETISRVCCSALPAGSGTVSQATASAAAKATARKQSSGRLASGLGGLIMTRVYPNGAMTATARISILPRRRGDRVGHAGSGFLEYNTRLPRADPKSRRVEEEKRSVLMRGEHVRPAVRAHFRGHHSLGSGTEPHQHRLAGAQFGHAVAAQCLHVNEDVRRALAAGQKPESAQAVEPFDN